LDFGFILRNVFFISILKLRMFENLGFCL